MRLGLIRGRRSLAAGLVMLAGCADDCGATTQQGAIGELGNGDFLYACTGSSDPACEHSSGGMVVDYFPDCIALHGAFDLEYRLLDDVELDFDTLGRVLYVESIHQGFFHGTDDFEALRVGEAAFVVREGRRALDLIHLRIVEPDGMEVLARDPATPTTELELSVGATEQLRVFPRSSTCAQLGGAIPITASSSDESIASTSQGDILRIQARAPGTAVIRVGLGPLEQALTVHVVDGPIEPDPGTTSDGPDATESTDGSTTGSGSDGSGSSGDTDGSGTGTGTGGSTGSTGGAT